MPHVPPHTLRTVHVTRYVEPLREGGSLPAIVAADDGFLYVIKFRGAGQGQKALVAELIGGEMARLLGLRVPELVFLELEDRFSKTEPDEEIQDLLTFSVGLNLGLHYLQGSITFDPLVSEADPLEASKVVLLDSLITNIDRTHRNPNLLSWHKELWLIDHGASLYFHHTWDDWEAHAQRPFPAIKDHVLLSKASQLSEAAQAIQQDFTPSNLSAILDLVPDAWLEEAFEPMPPTEKRQIYVDFLMQRLSNLQLFTQAAEDARHAHI